MASVFKRKYTKVVDDKRVKKQSQEYYTRLTDADGIKRMIPLFTDRTASEQQAAQLQREIELAKAGVVDRYKEHRTRPLVEHLADFRQSLLARGNTAKYANLTANRIRQILDGCGCAKWADIQASKIQRYVAGLRSGEKGISAQTFNYYLKAIKQFCRWMVQDGRASDSPLEYLRCETVSEVVDEEHPRRALEIGELRRLLRRALERKN